jgi:Tfp pilus assembly protein PilV
MELKTREGFNLVELVIATLLFGFMMMSLATIYSTANKHMFQNYRQNTVKSNASMAIKTITARLFEANKIDVPAIGASGNILRFADNVDQTSNCYPINNAVTTVPPVSWHEFCLYSAAPNYTTPGVACPSGSCLYYHTGSIPVNNVTNPGCPDGPAWSGVYPNSPPGLCGVALAGTTVTLLASFVYVPAGGAIFSRTGPAGNTVVNISMRIKWDPADPANHASGHDFSTTGKAIDTTLTTSVRVGRSGP